VGGENNVTKNPIPLRVKNSNDQIMPAAQPQSEENLRRLTDTQLNVQYFANLNQPSKGGIIGYQRKALKVNINSTKRNSSGRAGMTISAVSLIKKMGRYNPYYI
jgi:hypothetical protein